MNQTLRQQLNMMMGEISAIFMSQGETKSKDIIMPSTQLRDKVDEILKMISDEIPEKKICKMCGEIKEEKRHQDFDDHGDREIGFNECLDQMKEKLK